ncbi:MAG: hypothetical protein JST75_09435 [Bacteroidetes bacterium]|nr:hypothetical protein [Bacteroidota bacterium]
MKKYLFGTFAVIAAIAFFAFSAPVKVTSPRAITYFVYKGTGAQNNQANYTQQSTQPATCASATNLCWFSVASGSTFAATFSALDKNHDGVITSADQAEDHITVELKL